MAAPAKKMRMPAPLDDAQFRYLQELAGTTTGIVIEDSKRQMLYARLSRRLKELGLQNFGPYIERLRAQEPSELADFANRVTTNLTHFFREPGHFRYLADRILPGFAAPDGEERALRIWSAGCSTGQEPYSIAMTIDAFRPGVRVAPKILCTDLNSAVVDAAARGSFPREALRGLTDKQVRRWFRKSEPGCFEVSDSLKQMLIFKQHNLFGAWPIRGPVDAIFCRNVLIYFDSEAQRSLIERFTALLADGGHLFLGHSETLAFPDSRLRRVATTVYRKDEPS